jgi:hypothetical protein
MFAVTEPDGMLVAYPSWGAWRIDRRAGADLDPLPAVPVDSSFCALCWGQGRILSPAANGEGLIPVRCPYCDGERVVPSAR